MSKNKQFKTRVLTNQGNKIPIIGFGTHCPPPKDRIFSAVEFALETGYRLIDTAMNYQNERYIGSILERTKIPRSELFITTKVWKDAMRTNSVREAVEESLENLKIDYIDSILIHRPLSDYNAKTWQMIEDCNRDGLVKAIGVSNFLISHLEKLKESSTTVPAVNQIEIHPFFYRKELIEYCN